MSIFLQDFLAGARYPAIVKKFRGRGFGGFHNVSGFGPMMPLYTDSVGKVEFIRDQGVWSDTHSFGDKEFKEALKNAKEAQTLTGKGTVIYYSPFCEHKITDRKKLLGYFDKIRAACPDLILVNTPMVTGGRYAGALIDDPNSPYLDEVHINGIPRKPKGKYLLSWDGCNCTDSDVELIKKTFSDALILFFWHRLYNLNKSNKPADKKPRAQRTSKPTQKVVNMVMALYNPKLTPGIAPIHIYKTDSDQHLDDTAKDTRAHKVVFISEFKAPFATIVGENGKVIEKSAPSVVYTGNTKQMLYRFTKSALDIFNVSKTITIKVGNKTVGPITATHRDGTYRNTAD